MYLRTWSDLTMKRCLNNSHLAQVRCAVDIYEAGDILMVEISKQRNFPEYPFRELRLLSSTVHHFDGYWLSGYLVGSRAKGHFSLSGKHRRSTGY